MENYRKILGRNVRATRRELGWSQEDLAFETDIDRTYISGIERGVRNPSLDMLVKLAKTLKTTPNQLLVGIRGDPRRDSSVTPSEGVPVDYAANLGRALSTNRKNRVLRLPATKIPAISRRQAARPP